MEADSEQRAFEIRRLTLELALGAGTCHIGSALGIADVLAVLFFDLMPVDPELPGAPLRDTFILSKAHAGSALLSVLALRGTIDRSQLEREYCRDGGAFGGHAERGTPGVEVSGGSLGHGLPIAVGRAIADRLDGRQRRTYCLVGDGETDEGSVWEAVSFAGRLGLDRLMVIVDANGHQGLEHELPEDHWERFATRFEAFGWDVAEVDGHDHAALRAALSASGSRPCCVLAHTLKAKGLPFMEGRFDSHYRSLRPHERAGALEALDLGRAMA
ncbi:MAG: transketolase [Solirubrobacteraceae bacterium]